MVEFNKVPRRFDREGVKNRIEALSKHGPTATNLQNRLHGQRQAVEQQLIVDINKTLGS